ncbi:hypothetical protein F0Q45_10345 [Mycobacterium simiae]|uniref:Uncharacterized protein n=1 Tax=Mycobacterium simiae TaxID=1784 RepID=A0A5B1BTA7_MYCSI|nr:hypothetical protein [Mycobacterium simiae]KAA1250329.1 hypothetical protein F0Q45_10345 [Mycobacterium simiae]
MLYRLTAGGRTFRIDADDETSDILQWYIESKGTPEQLVALSRQQVVARIGRSALPTDFPDPDVVIGDPSRETGFTRGWFESTVREWEDRKLDTEAVGSAAEPQQVATPSGDDTSPALWPVKSRQWTDTPIIADGRVAIVTSRGIVKPSGVVVAGPMPSGDSLHKFLLWNWGTKPKEQPQVWFTYEALTELGLPMDDLPDDLPGLVSATFHCEVTWSQSGWFTCRFTDHDGQKRKAQLVLVPLMYLDQPPQHPGDMGVAGVEGTSTELPEDESEAVKILADRISWLAGVGDAGLVPASRWATVGAQLLDRKRQSGRTKQIEACPLPTEVAVEAGELEPTLPVKWDNRPHRAREDAVDVRVDQRAAYLASAGQVELGYGRPKELQQIKVDIFHEQRPPFGLWRLNLAPAEQIDGLTTKLPLPHPGMHWKEPTTLWVTTRCIQHLTAPVESGGAGLAVEELEITSAWVWPEQSRLLRTWADALRVKLQEAREVERFDYQQMIKAIYTTYLGRMASDKWPPYQREHQQPAWYAAIRADTRFRALRYAARIAAEHGVYPIAAELDAWIYRLPAGTNPSILDENSTANGKYRIKWTSADKAAGVDEEGAD